jgi:hypothetical protein
MRYETQVEIRIPTKQYAFLSPIGKLSIEIPDTATDEEAIVLINRANKIALLGAQKQHKQITDSMRAFQEAAEKAKEKK